MINDEATGTLRGRPRLRARSEEPLQIIRRVRRRLGPERAKADEQRSHSRPYGSSRSSPLPMLYEPPEPAPPAAAAARRRPRRPAPRRPLRRRCGRRRAHETAAEAVLDLDRRAGRAVALWITPAREARSSALAAPRRSRDGSGAAPTSRGSDQGQARGADAADGGSRGARARRRRRSSPAGRGGKAFHSRALRAEAQRATTRAAELGDVQAQRVCHDARARGGARSARHRRARARRRAQHSRARGGRRRVVERVEAGDGARPSTPPRGYERRAPIQPDACVLAIQIVPARRRRADVGDVARARRAA